MTPFTRKLAVAAVLAAALPAAALAHDRDGDRDEDCDRAPPAAYVPPPAAYVPPPAYGPAVAMPVPAPAEPYGWRERRAWRERTWRERAWRAREAAEIRDQLRALDLRRAEVAARVGGDPWRMARFDRWYGPRRAELEHRLFELQPVAWR